MDGWMDGWMDDGWVMGGWVGGWVDGWMDGWMDVNYFVYDFFELCFFRSRLLQVKTHN